MSVLTNPCPCCGQSRPVVKIKAKITCCHKKLIAMNHVSKLRSPKYLYHKINGYWFRLNYNQWGVYLGIKPEGISYRARAGYTVPVILKFKPMVRNIQKDAYEPTYAELQESANRN